MSFLSNLFAPPNFKHYQRLARASGEIRHHAAVKLSIEMDLLLGQHRVLMGNYQRVRQENNLELSERMAAEIDATDQFLQEFERTRVSCLEEHKALMAAATDVKGLAALCEYEGELAGMFKIALTQTEQRMAQASGVHVEAITYLRDCAHLST